MSFMNSYKRLENLCRGIYPDAQNGISGYIDDMDNHPNGSRQVSGWNNDYKLLKHYRWGRNQIAHVEYADEKNMCDPGDAVWLDNFYQRIMNQTDPLARLHQMSNPCVRKTPVRQNASDISQHNNPSYSKNNPAGCATMIFGVLLILAAIALFLFL